MPHPSNLEPNVRPRGSGPETAEAILDAAEEAFAGQGFEGTAMRDVASRVGIRAPSLYNHFPSKEALYSAVLERGVGPVLRMLLQFVETADETSWEAGDLLEATLTHLESHPHLPRLISHETLAGGQRLVPVVRDWVGPVFAAAEQLVERGPAAERWRAEQRPLLVLAMYHVVVGYFTMAPLYREVTGRDLLSASALQQQRELLRTFVRVLFEGPEDKD
ncbi:MAG: TetR/AcrR family transcriptional regulator [Myxococcales bacterium]|nr:TetR/AcrR family transcriptional regulator [Myxococcales bacterium]